MGGDNRNYLSALEPWYELAEQQDTMAVLRPLPRAIEAAKGAEAAYQTAIARAANDFMR